MLMVCPVCAGMVGTTPGDSVMLGCTGSAWLGCACRLAMAPPRGTLNVVVRMDVPGMLGDAEVGCW